MNLLFRICHGSLAALAVLVTVAAQAQSGATIAIQADQPGAPISSNLFGIFFEEINHAGDGGFYAELVRNRSFEEPGYTNAWRVIASGTATGQISADTVVPVSGTNLHSMKLVRSSGTGNVGVANPGYWGMTFQAGQNYDLRFYARGADGFTNGVTARLESTNGTTTYAQANSSPLTTNWQRFSLTLTPGSTDASGRLSLVITQAGTIWLDAVSLFPRQTFRGRTNGLRPDLAGLLTNLAPAFMRFPGGCFVEGDYLTNAFRWKKTVSDIATRPGHWNAIWSYYSSDGLGYHEYLQLCEDLGAEPLFVINCGMAHNEVQPLASMDEYVQDALDAIEYANGPTNSTWGAWRAAAGHPAPFNLNYIEIGNENGGTDYNNRYALFYDAIKSNYPAIHIVADNWGSLPTSRPVEISDEHYYSTPGFFSGNATKYDGYSRNGPKIYVGEYAVTTGAGNGNLAAALGEAAFMTGLERNADIVAMASYAPLFANLNGKDWNPDLIYFNGQQVYGTPSYCVQQMFMRNRGDVVLPLTLAVTNASSTNQPPHGAIGLGSWNTSVQFTNIVVTSNGVTLYQSDLVNSGTNGWRVYNGTWSTNSGLYQQTAISTDCRSTTGATNWASYTLTLRARKVSGNEGFLILFNWLDDNNWTWWNIGGWNNTQHAIQQMVGGAKTVVGSTVAGSIVTNQWYDIRIVLNGYRVQCYLNGTLIHDVQYPNDLPHGAVGLGTWNTQASFTNVVVASNGAALYQSDFSSGSSGWQVYSGTWSTSSGLYRQTGSATDCRSTTGDTNWSNYTLTLRARKDGGSEGFLILFNWLNDNNWTWWNIGGWNNTTHALEQMVNGTKTTLVSAAADAIQTNRWYDIRIVLSDTRIRCYLDDVLIHDYSSVPSLLASASYAAASGQIILKAVNVSDSPIVTALNLNGVTGIAPQAGLIQLTSADSLNENSLASPTHVAPVTGTVSNAGTNFTCTFPANSLSILRLQTPPASSLQVGFNTGTNVNDLATLPDGIPVGVSSFITNTVSVDYTIQAAAGAVVTNGTMQIAPGFLTANLLPPAALQRPGVFFRVVLSNPVNAQLGSITCAYFFTSSSSDDPLRIGLAFYPDEKLVYWTWPAATLQQTTNLSGSWTSITNAVCPIRIPEAGPQKFYRLTQ